MRWRATITTDTDLAPKHRKELLEIRYESIFSGELNWCETGLSINIGNGTNNRFSFLGLSRLCTPPIKQAESGQRMSGQQSSSNYSGRVHRDLTSKVN